MMGIVSAVCAVALLSALVPVHCEDDPDWWRTAVFYQIYPRSFKNTNGDGIGDLKGIKEKAEYLRDLGISAIWLSPIFKFPQVDFGYDISDYLQVDSMYATNNDLIDLIKTFHAVGLKVLLDYVPNHTSDQHDWFIKSVANDTTYRDWYIWKDPKGYDSTEKQYIPPNNWVSLFSGSAWQWNETRQQFYLHQFAAGQPDLNYANPAVVQRVKDNFKFWMDLGVDGFRVDSVPFLFEDDEFRDEPLIDSSQPLMYDSLIHNCTKDMPKSYDLVKEWSQYVHAYSKSQGKTRILLLEGYTTLEKTVKYYVDPGQPTLPFNFRLFVQLTPNKHAKDIMDEINLWRSSVPIADLSSWVVGNHDNKRITTRMGVEFADAMNMMIGMLPGIMVTYSGEELAMEDTFVRWDETVDTEGILLGEKNYLLATRDPERTPIQWDTSLNSGFTNAPKPWLPINPNYWRLNVEAQKNADKSHMKVYQQLMAARKTLTLKIGCLNLDVINNDIMVLERLLSGNDTYIGLINFGSEIIKPDLTKLKNTETTYVVHTSSMNAGFANGDVVKKSDSLALRPKAAVILKSYKNGASSLASSLVLCLLAALFLTTRRQM